MHDGHLPAVAMMLEHAAYRVRLLAGAGENHDGTEVRPLEQGQQQFIPLVQSYRIKGMADGGGHFTPGDGNFRRVRQAPFGKSRDDRRHGGGEEEGLPSFPRTKVDDFTDNGQEPHVQHSVHFIQNQGLDFSEAHGAAVEVVHQPAGSGHNDVRPFFQVFRLLSVPHAAIQQRYFQPGEFTVFGKGFRHLVGQFPGGFQHQYLRFADGPNPCQQREGESSGFPRPRLGGPNEVPAFQNDGNGLLLNGGGMFITAFLHRLQDGFR